MSVNNFNNGTDSKKRILDSARKEILEKGIIGMRVQDVAKGADTSITLIYRYFVDRNGVLARVLGDMYDDFRLSFQTKVEAWLAVNDSLSLEDFARLMPNPAEETKHARDFRLQVLATALENPELHERIKADERVVNLEKTHARDLTEKQITEDDDGLVVDVSFISLEKVIPFVIRFLKPNADVVLLIKPQFELGRAFLSKGGIVKDVRQYPILLENIKEMCSRNQLEWQAYIDSPILGGDGNKEFLGYFKRK